MCGLVWIVCLLEDVIIVEYVFFMVEESCLDWVRCGFWIAVVIGFVIFVLEVVWFCFLCLVFQSMIDIFVIILVVVLIVLVIGGRLVIWIHKCGY